MFKTIFVFVFLFGCSNYLPFATSYDIRNMTCKKRILELEPFMTVRIDKSFNGEEKKIIVESFKEWQKAINNMITFSFKEEDVSNDSLTWDCDGTITVYDGKNEDFRSGPRSHESTGGTEFLFEKDIFIYQEGRYFKRVILHEIGHILNYGTHSKHVEDIMFPIVTKTESLSLRDKINACQIVAAMIYPHIPEKMMKCGYLKIEE